MSRNVLELAEDLPLKASSISNALANGKREGEI